MADVVVSDHAIASIIHVQVVRDSTATDPQKAFSAQMNAPGFTNRLPLRNGSSVSFQLNSAPVQGSVKAEVDDFRVLPQGATPANTTAIACKVVFKLHELFWLTIGSVDVTAAFKSA